MSLVGNNKPASASRQDTGNGILATIFTVLGTIFSKMEAVRALLASNLLAIAPPPTSATVTIASGDDLSGIFQVNGKVVGFLMPAAWTTAALTFLGSVDGTNFFTIYDADAGTERSIPSTVALPNRMVMVDLSAWLGVKYLKVQSGTTGAPVTQTAARDVAILMVA